MRRRIHAYSSPHHFSRPHRVAVDMHHMHMTCILLLTTCTTDPGVACGERGRGKRETGGRTSWRRIHVI
jgi:hypothetical protein